MNCFGDSGMTDCSLAQPEKRAVGSPQLRRVMLNQAGRLSHRWSCPGALTSTGRALGSDHRGRERVAGLSVRTARKRRARPRMSVGWGGGRVTLLATRFGILGVHGAAGFMALWALLNSLVALFVAFSALYAART